VSLSDQDSSVMDRSGFEVVSEDDSLESSFHESSGGQTQDVIELVFGFVEETESEASSHEGFTFEESSGILFVKGQKFSGSLSHLGQNELDSPDFSLVLQTVFTDNFQSEVGLDNYATKMGRTRHPIFPFRKG